ncbi:hypothetical protein F2Q68_00036736, partial [Brassica cretica]
MLRHVDQRNLVLRRFRLHVLRVERPKPVEVDNRAVELVAKLVKVSRVPVRSRRKRYYSPSSDESFEDSRSKEKESFSDSGAEVVQPWVGSIRLGVSGEEEDSACGPLIDGVAMRALYPPRPTNKNILKNGGFEEGPLVLPGSTTRVLIPPFIEDDHSPLPGWMVESLKAVKYVDTEHFSIPQGRRAIELVVGKESDIAQVARTIIGKTYVLSFAVGDANNACKGSMV